MRGKCDVLHHATNTGTGSRLSETEETGGFSKDSFVSEEEIGGREEGAGGKGGKKKLSMGPSKWPSCYVCCQTSELRGRPPNVPYALTKKQPN